MEKDLSKQYSNGDITIVWKPSLCCHSKRCWNGTEGLPSVFDPKAKPWINMSGAATEKIIEQVKKCPSGALSYYHNDEPVKQNELNPETIIETLKKGPLLVHGNIVIKDAAGNREKRSKVTAFCRCGNSGNKPFCDGSHLKYNFEG
jgi:uncharacterized Fe-S cluster protein YjdI